MLRPCRNFCMEKFVGFIFGLAAGALIGVLIAPAPGAETRKRIKEEADKIVDGALASEKKTGVSEAHEKV